MKLKKMLISALLLAIGMILHEVFPPILFGMKPDMLLCMMFIAIILNDEYKSVIVIGIAAGILTALTTTFPGGQLPNIIDKIITCNFVYLMLKLIKNRFNGQLQILVISITGTLISGTAFLGAAALIAGLPGSFTALMLAVVIPAAALNLAAGIVLYNAVAAASHLLAAQR